MIDKKKTNEELIAEAKSFFETYKKEIGDSIRKGKRVVFVNFEDLSSSSPMLSEALIGNPIEILQVLETALEDTGLIKSPRIRFNTLPETQKVKIRTIRAHHLNQLIFFEGIIRQASDVRPQVVNAKFECPSCGTVISVLQIEKKFREPSRCSCGRKGQFRLISKTMVDAQRLVIEESPESLSGGEQPRRMSVFLKEDLVEPLMEEKTTPGSKIKVLGILNEVPQPLPTGSISTRFDLAVEANNIIPLESTFEDLDITEEDERQIEELAEDPELFRKLRDSIAPSIWGYEEIKEALVLQMFSGVRKISLDGSVSRGDIHLFLIGDPGVAKSQVLKFISNIAPRGRYVVGKSASGAGITATVVKDEFLKGWALEAGAMVLANNGVVCLHPDSNIISNNKIIPIKELFNEKESKTFLSNKEEIEISEFSIKTPSLLGDNLNIGLEEATMIRRKKYNGKLLKIKLDSSFNILLTPEHKLINGNTLNWQQAKDFRKGDFIFSPLKLPENNSELYILDILPDEWIVSLDKSEKEELKEFILMKYKTLSEFNKKYRLSRHYLSGGKQFKIAIFKQILNEFGLYETWKNRKLKYGRTKAGEFLKISKITPELSYFIGFAYGDGSIKINKRRSNVQIVQSTKNQKQISMIKKVFSEFSNRKLGECKRISDSIIRNKPVKSEHLILYSNSNLLAFLYDFFIKNSLSNILLMNDACLKAFIAGCLDSDGCVSIKNCTKNNKNYQIAHIEFLLSNNERANKNFILALRRLDCYSKLIIKKPISIIRITGREDVLTFLKEITPFSVKSKEIPEMKKMISSISSKLPIEPVSIICNKIINNCRRKEELNELGLSSVIYDYKNKKLQPSRGQLAKIKEKLPLSEELNKEIDVLLKRDFFIDKIIDISEEDYHGYVYDLFIPKTHNFVCEGIIVHNCIDEIEKMDPQDRSAMHEALEQQSVTISKANVQASLSAKTSVLAAGNPKFGRFEPTQSITEQIDLPPTLLNRFDLIFILRDLPNKIQDDAIATHVLNMHQKKDKKPDILTELFKKYVAYAKQKISPALTDEAVNEIKNFYVRLRNMQSSGDSKSIAISARQLQGLVRLAEAHAKSRLSPIVEKKDSEVAIKLTTYYLMQVGYDPETKKFDIDRFTTRISSSQRSKLILLRETIKKLEEVHGKQIPLEVLRQEIGNNMSDAEFEETMEKLEKSGDIYHPKSGVVQEVGGR